MKFPDEEKEFQACWSNAAGEASAFRTAANLLETFAAKAYIGKRDDVASEFRNMAQTLGEMAKAASLTVQSFITEDERRNYEKTKHFRK